MKTSRALEGKLCIFRVDEDLRKATADCLHLATLFGSIPSGCTHVAVNPRSDQEVITIVHLKGDEPVFWGRGEDRAFVAPVAAWDRAMAWIRRFIHQLSDPVRALQIYYLLNAKAEGDVLVLDEDEEDLENLAWQSVFCVHADAWNISATYLAARRRRPVSSETCLAICTPAYGGAHPMYVASVLQATRMLAAAGIRTHLVGTEGESLVTRARHNLVHLFLMTDATHMLFWDADIELPDPSTILKMLKCEKAVVAGAYPYRDGTDRFVLTYLRRLGNQVSVYQDESGCIEVRHAGTGFLLVERSAIEELYQAHPELCYANERSPPSPRWDVFGTGIVGGRYFSEDWMFCERWREERVDERDARHRVYVYAAAELVHHGSVGARRGSLRDRMVRDSE